MACNSVRTKGLTRRTLWRWAGGGRDEGAGVPAAEVVPPVASGTDMGQGVGASVRGATVVVRPMGLEETQAATGRAHRCTVRCAATGSVGPQFQRLLQGGRARLRAWAEPAQC